MLSGIFLMRLQPESASQLAISLHPAPLPGGAGRAALNDCVLLFRFMAVFLIGA